MSRRLTKAILSLTMLSAVGIMAVEPVISVVYAEDAVKAEGAPGQAIRITVTDTKKDKDILRSDKEDGEYEKIGVLKAGQTEFIDAGGDRELADTTWYYKVGNTLVNTKAGSSENLFATDTDATNYISMQLQSHAERIEYYYDGYTKGLEQKLLEDLNADGMVIKAESVYYGKRNKGTVQKITYTVAYEMTPEQEEELNKRESKILNEMMNMTDAEKVEKAYTYLSENIVLADKGDSAYNAIVQKKATSQGIAKAMTLLMKASGIECVTVNNDSGYFNLVRMADGLWYDVDATREIQSINEYEYNRYDYLLTPRLEEHAIEGYQNGVAGDKWRFSKIVPTNIEAMSDESGLTITWDRVRHATGYKVQRSDTKDGAYTDVVTYIDQPQEERGWTQNNQITDVTAEAGKNYYYRVKAYSDYQDGRDEGLYSDPQRIAYYGKLTLGINNSSVQPLLMWNEVEGASGYRILRRSAETEEEEVLDTVTGTSYTDGSAQYTKNYAYRIQVVRSTPSGETYEYYSNYATTYGISHLQNKAEGLEIAWASKNSDEGSRLYRYDNTTADYRLIGTANAGENTFIDTTAEKGKAYSYKVAPYTEAGINARSVEKEGVFLETPQVAGNRVNTYPVIVWSNVPYANKYEVYVDDELYTTVSCADTQLILTKQAGQTVRVKIRAITLTGNKGDFSTELTI